MTDLRIAVAASRAVPVQVGKLRKEATGAPKASAPASSATEVIPRKKKEKEMERERGSEERSLPLQRSRSS